MSQAAWEATLREQVDRNGRLFFQLAYGILHDDAAAEDACQQAFLRAWEQRDRIESQDKIQAWLARTVINLSYEALRRGKTERRALEAYARQSQPAGVLDGPVAPAGA